MMRHSRASAVPGGDVVVPAAYRLSSEIWAEIFTYCLPTAKFIKPSPLEAPLLLCCVCSDWRRVTMTTPKLWASLAVRVSRPSDLAPVLVQEWIDRSGILPLSLSLETPPMCPRSAEGALNRIVSTLFSCASRWLNISFTLSSPIGNALPTLDKAPLLREFSLYPSPYSKTRYAIPFNIAPHLRRFKWTPCLDLLAVQGIPWDQLTHLVLERGPSLLGCLDALRLCPNLIECGLSATLIQPFTQISPPIVHNRLRIFRITTDEYLGVFFDSLIIPQLEKLVLDIEDEYVYDILTGHLRYVNTIHPQLIGFISRSDCKLRSLSLRNSCLSPEELIDCLRLCPDLEELCICNGRHRGTVTDPVIKFLTVQRFTGNSNLNQNQSQTLLCPKLRRLQLMDCIDCSGGVLGRMIESRHEQPSGPLVHFTGVMPQKLSQEDVSILRECAQRGMNVSFRDVATCIP